MIFTDSELNKYVINFKNIENDGHIGIPVDMTILFDRERFTPKYSHGGTPIVIYVVNTMVERIGRASDEEIISGMIDRGYIVTVLDYLGNDNAKFPKIDMSVQTIRQSVIAGEYFKDLKGFNAGRYPETLVVPAGYDISYGNVYWEFDKHGSDGTLEKIVEIWNNDFRGTSGEKLVKWTDANGNRKTVQNGHDGSEPIWCDKYGNPDENGEYVRIKHSFPQRIADCAKPDGEPIDLKLYMHIVYPVNPEKKVPVMCLSSCLENLCICSATPDQTHMNGALFNGYAGVMFDYGYTPMARLDHYGYFDGYPKPGYITGDNPTYSVKFYNDRSDTAAMRYIRYLALSDERFAFDIDAIGVYGNSKGSWMSFIGEADPDAMPSRRIFAGHHDETRYENGDTESRDGINGGEEQPWLSYNGQKIFGGANLTYSCTGGTVNAITKGHAPMFVSCNRRDESCFWTSNSMVNLSRIYDIPSMWLEVPIAHALVHDEDLFYGSDSYVSFFDFANYHLKHDAVKVIGARVNKYAFPVSVTILFSGVVADSETSKIKITDKYGNILNGSFSSCYGKSEWTFTPALPTYGDGYTLFVPDTLIGENGKAIQSEYSYDIDFGYGKIEYTDCVIKKTSECPEKKYIAFEVTNDGVNTVCAYSENGVKIGSVNTSGKGWYKLDITSLDLPENMKFTLKCEKEAGKFTQNTEFLLCHNAFGGRENAPDGTSAVVVKGVKTRTNFPTEEFYAYPDGALICNDIIKDGPLDESDIGRRFRISFKVYDTDNRYISFGLKSASSMNESTADYHRVMKNEYTVKGEWKEYDLDYTVYEPMFGKYAEHKQCLTLSYHGKGNADTPIYFSDIKCEETVSEALIGKVAILEEKDERILLLGQSDIVCHKSPWSK
ncbi:MAG: hypothetical protein E7633_04265 [Ruminococcaceae bacterium]|nr:hypothetical protein [Oscillospiraceae bacterium]